MKLLDKEEIRKIALEYSVSSKIWEPERQIAKAQRQLCIEWGEEDCSDHLTHVTRAECPLCWKSLKE